MQHDNYEIEINTAGNTGFASGGVTCKLGALCFYSSSVQVDSVSLRDSPTGSANDGITPANYRNKKTTTP